MADASTRSSGGPIDEALSRLSEDARAQVVAAFDASGSIRYAWPDRYKAADLGLRALGASRVPQGRRQRKTYYRMPCGCCIKLEYARPWLFTRCAQHPPSPLDRAELGQIIGRTTKGIGMVAVVATAIASGVATMASLGMLVSGELKQAQLRVVMWYWLIFAAVVAWLIWQRRSSFRLKRQGNEPA